MATIRDVLKNQGITPSDFISLADILERVGGNIDNVAYRLNPATGEIEAYEIPMGTGVFRAKRSLVSGDWT